MKIAILGGTGDLGRGLALRWAFSHEISLGSRDKKRAKKFAEIYKQIIRRYYKNNMFGNITGDENSQVINNAEIIVFSVPFNNLIDFIRSMRQFISNDKIIISPIVPVNKDNEFFDYKPYLQNNSTKSSKFISAAEFISNELQTNRVVSTFHTLPAKKLCNLHLNLDYDVLMAGDDSQAITQVAQLITKIPNLRPFFAGPLKTSKLLESLTPLLLNVKLYNKCKALSIKLV